MPWQDIFIVLGVSAAPLSELRGGIPLALALGFTPTTAFFLALLGNLLPMPLILWLVPKLIHAVERFPGWLGEAGRKYLAWQERRHRRIVRWGPWALMVFVAVPLPGTGVWTGAVLAALLGIPMRFALLPLAFGVILAGSLVLLASLGFFRVFGS